MFETLEFDLDLKSLFMATGAYYEYGPQISTSSCWDLQPVMDQCALQGEGWGRGLTDSHPLNTTETGAKRRPYEPRV